MASTTPISNPHQLLKNWGSAVLLLVAATAGGFLLDHHVSLTSQAMVYVLAVVVASYSLRWQQSVACAVGAVAAFNFFFVPPRWTLEVDNQEHLIALFTMLFVALVISHLAARLRRESELAKLNVQRARQLQELAIHLSSAATASDIATLGKVALDSAFEGPCLLVLKDASGVLDTSCDVSSDVVDGLNCCMREAAVLGPGTGRWPGLNAWYLPLGDKGQMQGAARVQPALASDTAGREHAQALCTLLSQALLRLRMAGSMQKAQIEAQRQQLQSTYLAAISHDLRTPLAAVVGAASSLQTQRDKLSQDEQSRLLASIIGEATYLCSLTENTLQLVRLANASQAIARDWESMEEIVGAVLQRVRQRDPTRRIKSRLAQGLPLIKADPVLLTQLLENLLDNALKYSTDVIELDVESTPDFLKVSVKDRGPVIHAEKYSRLFEPYVRDDTSGQRGVGLGLSLCQAIAKAHNGSLMVRPRSGGGNTFIFTMSVDADQPGGEPS
jgi:two-component system sensor histidine kinase KdpD